MSFSYILNMLTDPTYGSLYQVRLLIGDTDQTEHFLEDEEINYFITKYYTTRDVYWVAASCCEAIAAKLARETNVSSDSQSASLDALMQKYLTMAENFRGTSKESVVGELIVGGSDSVFGDRPPSFGRGMHDDPTAGGQDYGDVGYVYDDWYSQWGWRP